MESSWFWKDQKSEEKEQKKQEEICEKCGLISTYIKGRRERQSEKGGGKPLLLVIGQNPGIGETAHKSVFTGGIGAFLDSIIEKTGLKKVAQICYTNIRKCGEKDKKESSTISQMKKCIYFLKKEIDVLKPQYILTLGKSADVLGKRRQKGIVFFSALCPHSEVWSVPHLIRYKDNGDVLPLLQILQALERRIRGDYLTPTIRIVNKYTVQPFTTFLEGINEVAIDIETTHLERWNRESRIISIAFSNGEETWVVLMDHPKNENIELQVLVNPLVYKFLQEGRTKIFHNFMFDVPYIEKKWKIKIGGIVEDTMIFHFLEYSENNGNGLKRLSLLYTDLGPYDLEVEAYFKGVKKEDISYANLPTNILLKYNGYDVLATYILWKKFKEEKVYTTLYKGVIRIGQMLSAVENNGIFMSLPLLSAYTKEMGDNIDTTLVELENMERVKKARVEYIKYREKKGLSKLEWSWKSPKTLSFFLYKILGLVQDKTTPTGNPSTSLAVLQGLRATKEVDLLYRLKKLWKEQSMYKEESVLAWEVESTKDGDCIHPQYRIIGAKTGRNSTHTPNFQNIPRMSNIRKCFVTLPKNLILSADYGQNEFRALVHYSGDPLFREILNSGGDVHGQGMEHTLGKEYVEKLSPEEKSECRVAYKCMIFGLIYGKGYRSIAEDFWAFRHFPKGGPEQFYQESKDYLDKFFSKYPDVGDWLRLVRNVVQKRKQVVSHYGRVRRLPQVTSSNNDRREAALRQACNFPLQSWSSDVTSLSAERVYRYLCKKGWEKNIKIFSLVHDSIYMYVPYQYVQVMGVVLEYIMLHPPLPLSVPLKVDCEVQTNLYSHAELVIEEELKEILLFPELPIIQEIVRGEEKFQESQEGKLVLYRK